MEPSVTTEVEGEPKERKKIQFAVPSNAPPNLDPRQVEMGKLKLESPSPKSCSMVRLMMAY